MDQQHEALQQASLLERGRELALRGLLALGISVGAVAATEAVMPSEVALADYECPYELPDYYIDKTDPVTGAVSSIAMCYGDKPTPTTKPPVTNPPATNPPATHPPATNPPATNPPATPAPTPAPTTAATTAAPETTLAPTTTERVTTTTVELDPTTTTLVAITTTEKKPLDTVVQASVETSGNGKAIAGVVALAALTGGGVLVGLRRRKKDEQ